MPSASAPAVRGIGRRLRLPAAVAALALLPAMAGAADALRLRCTNPASGASWQIVVDLEHGRVDSLPATIAGDSISWHDPKRGFFDLDRATLRLELRNASATGGYFLHYVCRPEQGGGKRELLPKK